MVTLDEKGLIPAIVQDAQSGEVLMHAYMDREALQRTIESGQAWFYSRSRQELWHKGSTSGNYINVKALEVDCDGDTLLVKGEPTGPVCHTGNRGCFFQDLDTAGLEFERKAEGPGILEELAELIEGRKAAMPAGSYVTELLAQGTGRIAQKVIEEAGESAIVALQHQKEGLVGEVADLWFHSLVLLAQENVKLEEVWEELRARRR